MPALRSARRAAEGMSGMGHISMGFSCSVIRGSDGARIPDDSTYTHYGVGLTTNATNLDGPVSNNGQGLAEISPILIRNVTFIELLLQNLFAQLYLRDGDVPQVVEKKDVSRGAKRPKRGIMGSSELFQTGARVCTPPR